MTRVNLVPVTELHQKHLVAEYREIGRIYELARKAYPRRSKLKIPAEFCLGPGHVTYFYNKLGFILARHSELVIEMRRRGYAPAYIPPSPDTLPEEWLRTYQPTEAALLLSRARIVERTKPSWTPTNSSPRPVSF